MITVLIMPLPPNMAKSPAGLGCRLYLGIVGGTGLEPLLKTVAKIAKHTHGRADIPMIQTPCHMRRAYRPPFREGYWPTNQRGNRPWIRQNVCVCSKRKWA
jgi:hypothetical protein